MKKILYVVIFFTCIILTACPYESPVELNTYENSLKIDKKLIGEWVAFKEDGGREELTIDKAAKSVFYVTQKSFENKNKFKEVNKYRAYSTDIGGFTVFNIEKKDGKYIFAKYAWTGKNEFYIQTINADYVAQNFKPDSINTENLRSFISDNVNKEKMYDDKFEFYRKDSPEYNKVKMYMQKSGF